MNNQLSNPAVGGLLSLLSASFPARSAPGAAPDASGQGFGLLFQMQSEGMNLPAAGVGGEALPLEQAHGLPLLSPDQLAELRDLPADELESVLQELFASLELSPDEAVAATDLFKQVVRLPQPPVQEDPLKGKGEIAFQSRWPGIPPQHIAAPVTLSDAEKLVRDVLATALPVTMQEEPVQSPPGNFETERISSALSLASPPALKEGGALRAAPEGEREVDVELPDSELAMQFSRPHMDAPGAHVAEGLLTGPELPIEHDQFWRAEDPAVGPEPGPASVITTLTGSGLSPDGTPPLGMVVLGDDPQVAVQRSRTETPELTQRGVTPPLTELLPEDADLPEQVLTPKPENSAPLQARVGEMVVGQVLAERVKADNAQRVSAEVNLSREAAALAQPSVDGAKSEGARPIDLLAQDVILPRVLAPQKPVAASMPDPSMASGADLRTSVVDSERAAGRIDSLGGSDARPVAELAQSLAGVKSPAPLAPADVAFDMAGKGRIGSHGWRDALSERVMVMAARNGQVAEIQLDPPELGSLKVRVHIGQDQVSVSFSSPHASVRDAVEQSIPRLREMMEEQGLSLGESSVSDQSGDERRDSDESGVALAEESLPLMETAPDSERGDAASISLVDYYA